MPNENDSSTTQRKRCTEKTAGLETLTKEPPPYGRDSHESLPKQTMELSKDTQIHSGDGTKATTEGHKFYQELLKEKSNPRLKGNRKGIIVKGKEFYIPILNTFSHKITRKSPKEKDGDLITTRPELVPKRDLVAKEILRSERVRRISKTQTRPKGRPSS